MMMVTTMVMVVVMMMTMLVVMVVPVVFATGGCGGQLAVQVRRHELFHGCVGKPGAHGDAMMGEIGQGTLTNATGNDNRDALLTQPTRERAGLMFRRRQYFGLQRQLLVGIDLDQRKLAATAEVAVQPTGRHRDGNADGTLLGCGSGGVHNEWVDEVGLKLDLIR